MPRGRITAVIGGVTSDAGLMMDRVRYLRDNNYSQCRARELAARHHQFTYQPADAERFFEMLLPLADKAAQGPAMGCGLQYRDVTFVTRSRLAPTFTRPEL